MTAAPGGTTAGAVLAIEGLAVRFGGVQAVGGVDLRVERGEFIGLIGPNGAGKTTLVRLIAGVLKPDQGRILLAGSEVTRLGTAARIRRGLALTHQIVRPFREATVLDNVALAAGYRHTVHPLHALLRMNRHPEEARAAEIIRQVGLAGTEGKLAGALPLGQLKRLEVARALAVDPKIVLLDEPLAGLNHAEAARQIEVIASLNAGGLTILLIEHNLAEVMRHCRRLVVLENGRMIGDGVPTEVIADPAVHAAYLGAPTEGPARAKC